MKTPVVCERCHSHERLVECDKCGTKHCDHCVCECLTFCDCQPPVAHQGRGAEKCDSCGKERLPF